MYIFFKRLHLYSEFGACKRHFKRYKLFFRVKGPRKTNISTGFNWCYISQYGKLSEDFIREFKDSVVWDKIFFYQTLSKKFIVEFKDKLQEVNKSLHFSRFRNPYYIPIGTMNPFTGTFYNSSYYSDVFYTDIYPKYPKVEPID